MRDAVLVRALVDIQQVPPQPGVGLDGRANINIRPAVIIDIDYRGAPAPFPIASNPGDIGNVFENKIPLIQVKLIGYHIAGKIDIRQAIVIKIADANTGPIVNIDDVKNIDTVIFCDLIIEVNAGML